MRYIIFTFILVVTQILPAQDSFHKNEIESHKRAFHKWQTSSAPTVNQTKYDVSYYKLDFEVDATGHNIDGYTQVDLSVTDGPLSQIDLNFYNNMHVTSVFSGDTALTYVHDSNILTITLNQAYETGSKISLKIYYNGNPSWSGSGAFRFSTYSGKPHFWTLSEPYGAREWFPCKDIPEDKADSAAIVVTTDESILVASNGLLISQSTQNGKATFHWKESYPITTYLISIAGYAYTHYSDQYETLNGSIMPIEFYVYPDHYSDSYFRSQYAKTKDMIHSFALKFGEYPFVNEKYGHAEFLGGGGMEHQTLTSLDGYGEDLISHELGHQWWGDMITCKNFHHIWLNEGFATYCEALWIEDEYGTDSYHSNMDDNIYKGGGTIYVQDDTDENAIFDWDLSYRKASYVLHMLRHIVGEETFFQILQTYYAENNLQYNVAVTEDFQEVCETVSGMKLDKFFQQWIYGEYYPSYQYSWSSTQSEGSYQINLNIDQVQSNTGFFWSPIDVKIDFGSSDTTLVVWDSLETQSFELYIDQEPQGVELDPDNWILRDVEQVAAIVGETKAFTPNQYMLYQNYPNPFNPGTVISYVLPKAENVTLSVFNALGQKVKTLVSGKKGAGKHSVTFDATGLVSGVYIYRLTAGKYSQTKKMILLQ